MRAIIIDDEPKAIELLKSYLQHFSSIQLLESFRNGIKAFEYLQKEQVDLVFLDINMPHLSGISLSKMIDSKVNIIFTTAYSEYAVESYEVDAIDYLLKPISLERFTKAISKLLTAESVPTNKASDVLLLKSGSKIFRVHPEAIFYLKKEGNYMTYHLKDKKILTRATSAEALESLPDHFVQIHKSYIVNLQKIDFIHKEIIAVQNEQLPIGNSFKSNLLEKLNPSNH